MFFHIDESGNTGNNLFDRNQPVLSYGLLSSTKNVDALGENIHTKMLKELGVTDLHANELGVEKLTRISKHLYALQKKIMFDFDYYFIEKPSYALVLFFDAVFDAGINEAVKWDHYWTPMRFLIIHKLSLLFDDELLKESWRLCTHKRIENQKDSIIILLKELLSRVERSIPDTRTKEIITDALRYGISFPLLLDFGFDDPKAIAPNTIGFQFIITAMARHLRKKRRKNASSIVVDRQNEFNQSQISTHYMQNRIAEGLKTATNEERRMYLSNPLYVNFSQDEILKSNTPDKELSIKSSHESIGLQIVDIYLWIINRYLNDKPLSIELKAIASTFTHRSIIDGISMKGMAERWKNFETLLPAFSDITEQQHNLNNKMVLAHREKVKTLNM
jgi:hypothetical protein